MSHTPSSSDEPIEEMDELDTSGVTEEYQNEPAELENPVAEDPEAFGHELTDQEREYLEHLAEPDDLIERGVYDRMEDQATVYQVEFKIPTRRSDDKVRDQATIYGTEIHEQIEKHYTDMVHRNPDGSDPLVEEPGP